MKKKTLIISKKIIHRKNFTGDFRSEVFVFVFLNNLKLLLENKNTMAIN